MTLTIIFGFLVLLGIGLCVWAHFDYSREWPFYCGVCLAMVFGVALIVNLLVWIPSQKNSEIIYTKLQAEKQTIEAMLETEKDVDRFRLNSAVINYNNRIIEQRMNFTRPILNEYYNHNFDWAGLELIEWK